MSWMGNPRQSRSCESEKIIIISISIVVVIIIIIIIIINIVKFRQVNRRPKQELFRLVKEASNHYVSLEEIRVRGLSPRFLQENSKNERGQSNRERRQTKNSTRNEVN